MYKQPSAYFSLLYYITSALFTKIANAANVTASPNSTDPITSPRIFPPSSPGSNNSDGSGDIPWAIIIPLGLIALIVGTCYMMCCRNNEAVYAIVRVR